MRRSSLVVLLLGLPVLLAAQGPRPRPQPAPEGFGAPFTPRPYGRGAVRVGPPRGTVVVVGGGSMGPEIHRAFIEAAGGNNALILSVPNAGGSDTAPTTAGRGWGENGARNVGVLFTRNRKVAESDSFTARIGRAGGIWFEGGRQFHLVQDYGGTRTERAINEVLDRGGVVGGSSAGASILGDFMVRGAPSSDNTIMEYPGYARGFGYLRNVGIDQHVVARSRLPDLADSIITRYPDMLAISVDEGTAWVIRGDTGRIVGRSKAFVYNGGDLTDAGSPFLTLHPGDRYDLGARRVISRASERYAVSRAFIDTLFARFDDPAVGGATVLVAKDGDVLVNRAFGVAAPSRFMPRTTLPLFDVGDIAGAFTALCAQMPVNPPARATAPGGAAAGDTARPADARRAPLPAPLQGCFARVAAPVGVRHSVADSTTVRSSVDELYRFALGLEVPATYRGADHSRGWSVDSSRATPRYARYHSADGRRGAFVRVPDQRATVIVLTNDATADAREIAERILDRLLAGRP